MPDLSAILEKELFPFVEKPMRYIGNELNCIRKDLSSVSLHGVLCFPEIYDIGMSHYGSQILYHIVNKHSRWALSRCYHPWPDAETIMRRKDIPLYSLEYFSPVSNADWLGFSIQYELQYTNFINMLNLAGVPVLSSERRDIDPLIIAGGPCMGNPEPIADFCDACAVGDGEKVIVSIYEALDSLKRKEAYRQEKIKALAEIEGIYVPRLYPVTKKGLFFVPELNFNKTGIIASKVERLEDKYQPTKPLVPLIDVIHHRLTVEVMRGCTRGCRFCSAGNYYRPVRERIVSSIVYQVKQSIESTGWRNIGLLSLSTADYSGFELLVHDLRGLQSLFQIRVSLPSTRIDALTKEQIHAFNAISHVTSFTIAPEAGTQRMRNVINKDFTEENILDTVHTLLENNIQTLKLYFMIGFPTETEDDINGIIALVAKISDIVWEVSKKRRINVTISPFSPKSHTPFQWEKMDSIQTLLDKSRRIKSGLRKKRNVEVSYRDPTMTFLETILARGDRSLSTVILEAWRKGARFDGWKDHFRPDLWKKASDETGVSFKPFVENIPEEQELPWSAVSIGVSTEFLLKERKKSFKGLTTEDCRNKKCIKCGIYKISQRYIIDKYKMAISETGVDGIIKRDRKREESKRYLYRVEYSKCHDVRFISHKDMVNIFHRAFCAAKTAIAYSQGFHPRPKIAFGPPLPLGIMGTRELFDMITTEQISLDSNTLITWLPKGLRINKCRLLKIKPVSLNASIVAARYSFIPLLPMSYKQLFDAVNNVNRQKILYITVTKKDKHIKKELKPLIYDLSVKKDHGTDCIEAVLSMLPQSTCRPTDLIQCLFPDKNLGDFLVTRISCLKEDNGKFINV